MCIVLQIQAEALVYYHDISTLDMSVLQTVSQVNSKVYLPADDGIIVIDEKNKISSRIPMTVYDNNYDRMNVFASSDTIYIKRDGALNKMELETNSISPIDLPEGFLDFSKILVSPDNVISISGSKSDGSYGIGEFNAELVFTEIENESKAEVSVIQRIN